MKKETQNQKSAFEFTVVKPEPKQSQQPIIAGKISLLVNENSK